MGRTEFVARTCGLSGESRFLSAWRDGKGPEPGVEESAVLLDSI